MDKAELYAQELAKLSELFADVEENKAKLIQGLMEDAAFLCVENKALREVLGQTGMVKVHPQNAAIQKPVEGALQYLKNVNSYAVVIKTLNGILQKNTVEDDDDFDKFMNERK
ncbi:hypothetical protein [Paenibacillus oleatilyticus]|uniref:hypothetical protein n=1 Tax=Paenibacillus oleatilyticus TaxID=2594886 RepID=UPI001C1F2AEC|nr:hypothetical protein [Paenibacillus oleatilyticus]MBU7320286.1 hypothetical protein [Paenibacillus oleatilyticus]